MRLGARRVDMPEDHYFTPRGRLLAFITVFHRGLYRWSGGRLGTASRGKPTLLLTTTGRKSGQAHTVPLPYLPLPESSRMVVVASFAGNPKHPAWYLNADANPEVTVQYGRRKFAAVASTASGDERADLWKRVVNDSPWYADYQAQTTRQIPLVILTPAPLR